MLNKKQKNRLKENSCSFYLKYTRRVEINYLTNLKRQEHDFKQKIIFHFRQKILTTDHNKRLSKVSAFWVRGDDIFF